MQMKEKLELRAKQSLLNPNEITQGLIERCVTDAQEICKGREVPYFAKEDFAYIRLKIYLKAGLDDQDLLLLETAQKAIKNSPFVNDAGELSSAKFYKSKARKDVI
nr:MAG TPA: hypothetical protein [Caudoviricetes sp.]